MRNNTRIRFIGVAFLGGFLGSSGYANIVGVDVQNFNPITSGVDFVTVQSSETLAPGIMNIGIFANISTNTLPRFGGTNPLYSDSLISSDLNVGFGLLKNWEIGANFPALLYQAVSNTSGFGGNFSSAGFTGLRLNTKYRFFGDSEHGLATIVSSTINFVDNNPYAGIGSGPGLNLEMAYDHTFGKVAAAVNFGHRWLNPGSQLPGVPIEPLRNQWIASIAGNYALSDWNSKVILEVFGSIPVSRTNADSDRQQTSFEALLGFKHDFSHQVAGHVGIGRKLIEGTASPEFRSYVGVNISTGPVYRTYTKPLEPGGPVPGERAPAEHFVTRNLHFVFDTAEIVEDYRPVLNELVAVIKKGSLKTLVIEGHTDSMGNLEYNQNLSERRAEKVSSILAQEYGLDQKKFVAKGFSYTRPVDDNRNYQGPPQNRRVEFKIYR